MPLRETTTGAHLVASFRISRYYAIPSPEKHALPRAMIPLPQKPFKRIAGKPFRFSLPC
jgi:hypothetical protein